MHELAITDSVISAILDALGDEVGEQKVARVTLEIGDLSGVVADAVRFCFDVCAKGTVVEGAILEIRAVKGQGRCAACGAESEIEGTLGVAMCAGCGSLEVQVLQGTELSIREVELA